MNKKTQTHGLIAVAVGVFGTLAFFALCLYLGAEAPSLLVPDHPYWSMFVWCLPVGGGLTLVSMIYAYVKNIEKDSIFLYQLVTGLLFGLFSGILLGSLEIGLVTVLVVIVVTFILINLPNTKRKEYKDEEGGDEKGDGNGDDEDESDDDEKPKEDEEERGKRKKKEERKEPERRNTRSRREEVQEADDESVRDEDIDNDSGQFAAPELTRKRARSVFFLFQKVEPEETGYVVRLWKPTGRLVGPGIHLVWPLIEWVMVTNGQLTTIDPPWIVVLLKRGQRAWLDVVIFALVENPIKAVVETQHAMGALLRQALAPLTDEVSDLTIEEILDPQKRKELQEHFMREVEKAGKSMGLRVKMDTQALQRVVLPPKITAGFENQAAAAAHADQLRIEAGGEADALRKRREAAGSFFGATEMARAIGSVRRRGGKLVTVLPSADELSQYVDVRRPTRTRQTRSRR